MINVNRLKQLFTMFDLGSLRLKGKAFIKNIKAFAQGYRKFKVVNEHREQYFTRYSEAEASYLVSIRRKDKISHLMGRKAGHIWESFGTTIRD